MKKFVYLYFVSKTIPDDAENGAIWGKWFESIGEHLIDAGNAF